MANVLIVAYLLIVLALIAVILLQRSEGGALGIGGGGVRTARGSANLLTRTTAILAALFFATAIGLTIMSELDRSTSTILDRAVQTQDGQAPATVLDALNALQGDSSSDLPVPAPAAPAPSTAPAAPEAAAPAAPEATAPAAESASDLPVPEAPAPAEPQPAAPATN